jgi:hypothetical protein
VRYFGGEVTAQLGDRIELRGLLRKRRGVLNYVPGLSVPHPEMEHHALHWVGIALDNGTFTGVLVDPETGWTLKQLVFVGRGLMDGGASVPAAPFD